ncbi:MAG: MoaD/ThiS family protein [Bacteroidia bacterium]|nr:MoaD/ThiS family protein [Bacteroidia bacterium]
MQVNNKIVIRFFGMLIEKTGCENLEFPFVDTTAVLMKNLIQQFPELEKMKFAISINCKINTENQFLKPGDEIALLPPFSGG